MLPKPLRVKGVIIGSNVGINHTVTLNFVALKGYCKSVYDTGPDGVVDSTNHTLAIYHNRVFNSHFNFQLRGRSPGWWLKEFAQKRLAHSVDTRTVEGRLRYKHTVSQ